ncbi:MAG: M23 family metallopeptidase [Alphaproteobacteria bacterium]
MTTASVGHIVSMYRRCFPERQIYHRCNHQVHFTTISGRAQVIAVVMSFLVFGWIAFASVNVMFTTQITASMEKKLRESKRRWEGELAHMIGDYDRLQSGLAVVREELDVTLRELEERQRQVDTVLEKKTSLLDRREEDLKTSAAFVFTLPKSAPHTSVTVLNQHDVDPTPRVSRFAIAAVPPLTSDLSGIIRKVSRHANEALPSVDDEVAMVEELEVRFAQLHSTQFEDLVTLEETVTDEIGRLEVAMDRTEFGYTPMLARFESALRSEDTDENGQGGPFISVSVDQLNDNQKERLVFQRKAYRIRKKLRRLAALREALHVLPITAPLTSYKRISDGFGMRIDPFNGSPSRHRGIDFSAWKGTPVVATAGGRVYRSSYSTSFGKYVLIDHGNGFRTLYGHLDERGVKGGQTVERGDVIGKVGNTGRSTAPHLHYEVRYRGKHIDPRKFLEAGRYVFENEGQ